MVRTLLVTFDTSQTGSTTAALLQAVEVGCVNRCRARRPKGVAWRPAGCLSTASKESPETGAVRVSNSQEPNVPTFTPPTSFHLLIKMNSTR